ncbi:HEPN domain-containing protein [Oliverpabstia intestinalis]|uniref:ApeA N-terminal domain 1-containing protein n=1 Tax=Oliverpabstia intestinalis TaxID=2606633 RepID=UPI003F89B981
MSEEIRLSGEWFINETEEILPGTLHINESEKHIYLVLTKLCTPENPLSGIKARGKVSMIKGNIDTGGNILLYDCKFGGQHTQIFQRTQVAISVKYAFWNLNVANIEELRFPKVSVDFGEVLEWADLCFFESDYKDEMYAFKWKCEEKIEYSVDDNTCLTICPVFGGYPISVKQKEIHMNQKIVFQLSYEEPKQWRDIIKDIRILRNILSLGMCRSIYIDGIEYYHDSHKMEEIPEYIHPMKIFSGTGEVGKQKPGNPWEYLFTLKDLTDNGCMCLKNCFSKYQKLKPIVELATVAFHYKDISTEMLFLNLTQGLETYHARFVSDNPKVYFEMVDHLVQERYGVSSKDQYTSYALADRAFMISERNEDKTKQLHLKSRLGYLFYMRDEVWTGFIGYSREEFLQKMVDTRNYFTHYSESKENKIFSKEVMPYVNGILMAYLNFYILKEIGIEENKNLDSFRKKMVDINRTFDENKLDRI